MSRSRTRVCPGDGGKQNLQVSSKAKRRYLPTEKTDIYTVYVYIYIWLLELEEIPETQLEDSFVVLVEHSKV